MHRKSDGERRGAALTEKTEDLVARLCCVSIFYRAGDRWPSRDQFSRCEPYALC